MLFRLMIKRCSLQIGAHEYLNHRHAVSSSGSVKIISPCVIGTGYWTSQFLGFFNQNHSIMTAHVLKHLDLTWTAAHHNQRNSQKVDKADIARNWHIKAKADSGPGWSEYLLCFNLKHNWFSVTAIWQAFCTFNWLQNWNKCIHIAVFLFERRTHCFFYEKRARLEKFACLFFSRRLCRICESWM